MYNGKLDIITYSDIGGGVFFVCRDSLHLSKQQFLWQRVYLMYSCNGVEIESVEVSIIHSHDAFLNMIEL